MNKDNLITIIKDALETEDIDFNSSMENTDGWDSLGHLSILSAIDQNLDGQASKLDELASATSVENIISILKKIIYLIDT